VLLQRSTKLFLIPAISISKTSLVSVALLCNILLPKRFCPLPFGECFRTLFPRQQSGNGRSIKRSRETVQRQRHFELSSEN
jgi:hypothetical protein